MCLKLARESCYLECILQCKLFHALVIHTLLVGECITCYVLKDQVGTQSGYSVHMNIYHQPFQQPIAALCVIHGYFQPIPSPVSGCSLSDICTHTPMTSSVDCAPITCKVVSLPGKGLNYRVYISLQRHQRTIFVVVLIHWCLVSPVKGHAPAKRQDTQSKHQPIVCHKRQIYQCIVIDVIVPVTFQQQLQA